MATDNTNIDYTEAHILGYWDGLSNNWGLCPYKDGTIEYDGYKDGFARGSLDRMEQEAKDNQIIHTIKPDAGLKRT